jgi:hypothetical protein
MRLLAGGFALVVLAGCAAPGQRAALPAVDEQVRPAVTDAGAAGPVLGATCTSPEGFQVDHPADWSVNSGDVLPPCSWFDPAPFVVPEATDARAAVTLRVLPAGDPELAFPDEVSRSTVPVGGRDALRVEQVTRAGLYPVGTPITSYVVDLGNGRVLLADTVGLPGTDPERDVAVLDAMMASLDVEDTLRA